jgi:phosphopentomutase
VYTSADSVFQVAAHEEIIPIEELYRICQIARDMLVGEHAVGRVIARPFSGRPGNFTRTERRKDFSLEPPADTVLDKIKAAGMEVVGIGKIEDIFAGRGLTISDHTGNNMAGVDSILSFLEKEQNGLIFANLVDFDALYGHRNNPQGYAEALEAFDRRVPEILRRLKVDDILIITADHGNDPTTPSTDHSRERVPVLVTGPLVAPDVNLGTRNSFADVAATVAELLRIEWRGAGASFAPLFFHRQP